MSFISERIYLISNLERHLLAIGWIYTGRTRSGKYLYIPRGISFSMRIQSIPNY